MGLLDRDIAESLFSALSTNQTVRIMHEYDSDGQPCSINKDPCMNVTKTTNGLLFHCHRCSISGYMSMDQQSPEALARAAKRIKRKVLVPPPIQEGEYIQLPKDVVPLVTLESGTRSFNYNKIPQEVFTWFWRYKFDLTSMVFPVYWSDGIQRIIFPIRNKKTPFNLIGYVARSLDPAQPKYITRKNPGVPRLFYKCEGLGKSAEIVFVEDILSALRVNWATGMDTVALLTSHVSLQLVKEYKDRTIYIWLDYNMKSKATKYVRKFTQHGIKVKAIVTKLDPKEYSNEGIRKWLNEKS